MAGGVAEELKEVGLRTQQESGVVALQPVLIGRHRAVEREEVGILAIGFGEQAVALAVARAAHLLGGGIGFSDDDGGFAIGLGADFLRLLSALGAALVAGWAAAAGGWPDELLKNLKKSESGRSRNRVSLLFNPFS